MLVACPVTCASAARSSSPRPSCSGASPGRRVPAVRASTRRTPASSSASTWRARRRSRRTCASGRSSVSRTASSTACSRCRRPSSAASGRTGSPPSASSPTCSPPRSRRRPGRASPPARARPRAVDGWTTRSAAARPSACAEPTRTSCHLPVMFDGPALAVRATRLASVHGERAGRQTPRSPRHTWEVVDEPLVLRSVAPRSRDDRVSRGPRCRRRSRGTGAHRARVELAGRRRLVATSTRCGRPHVQRGAEIRGLGARGVDDGRSRDPRRADGEGHHGDGRMADRRARRHLPGGLAAHLRRRGSGRGHHPVLVRGRGVSHGQPDADVRRPRRRPRPTSTRTPSPTATQTAPSTSTDGRSAWAGMSAWPLVWTGLGVLVVVGTASLLLRRARRGSATSTSSDDDPRGT